MPFGDYSDFDTTTLNAMTAAYDAALTRLGITAGDPRTSNLAAIIGALAAEGQRDPDLRCEHAIAGLAK
jgi:hypothetical protein